MPSPLSDLSPPQDAMRTENHLAGANSDPASSSKLAVEDSRSTAFWSTLWGKMMMVGFGIFLGVALLETSLRLLRPYLLKDSAGTSFESLEDVRRAILAPPGTENSGFAASPEVSRANLRDIVNAHHDDRIIFDLKPNLQVEFQRAQVQTNSCGMRDVERSISKPLNTYRIALLGDSFAFGWGVEQHETFAQRLEENLNRVARDTLHFEVLNFGVPGYATFQEVALFKESGLDFNPDEVLVFFVQNDFDIPFFVKDLTRPGGILSSSEFLRLGLQAVDPNQAQAFQRQQATLRGLDPSSALTELSDLCRARGIRLSIAINPRKEWRTWRDQIPVLRQRRDIRVFSMRSDFMRLVRDRKIPTEALTLSFDPHPSPLRHAMYGDLMTPYFMDVIPAKRSPPRSTRLGEHTTSSPLVPELCTDSSPGP